MKHKVYTINIDEVIIEQLESYYNEQVELVTIDMENGELLIPQNIYARDTFLVDFDKDAPNNQIANLRATGASVICLTEEASQDDRVRLHSFGASTIISKPYRVEELIYNIVPNEPTEVNYMLVDINFRVDLKRGVVFYEKNCLSLSKKLICLLVTFMENENEILSRKYLIEEVYYNRYTETRNIDTLVKQLRQMFSPNLFVSYRGQGYAYYNC